MGLIKGDSLAAFTMWVALIMIPGFLSGQDPEWVVYDTSNSPLPDNFVNSVATDRSGVVWIGTLEGHLVNFRDGEWTLYDSTNSDMPPHPVEEIAVDYPGQVWIGTWDGGLAKLDREGN